MKTEEFSGTKTPRRRFIGNLAGGAGALLLSSVASPVRGAAGRFETATDMSEADEWFHVKGKHRIVYDATTLNGTLPLGWSWVFLNTNNDTGTPDTSLSVVVILRHEAIPLAMKDSLWQKYDLGKVFKIDDPKTKTASHRNFMWNAQEGDLMVQDWSIDRLQKRGVKFCVCNMAITIYSGIVAKEMGMDAEAVKQEWIAGLHPDIQLVPSGVWAAGRAQENGCAYVFAG